MDRQSHRLKCGQGDSFIRVGALHDHFGGERVMSFVEASSTENFAGGSMKGVEANGKSILLINLADKFYAIGNVCTHMGCKLSSGSLKGEIIHCVCHGSRFDAKTGKVVGGPATKSEPAFEVKVEGSLILVKV